MTIGDTGKALKLAGDRPAWDRQPREPAADHAKFLRYLAAADRALHVVAAELGMRYGSVRNLAAKWEWTIRAASWDADQARAAALKLAALREQMATDQAAVARTMLGKAAAAVLALNPESLSPTEAARWVDIAVKVQRAALGEPERTVAVTGGGPGSAPIRLTAVPTSEAERVAALRSSLTRLAELAGADDALLAGADPADFEFLNDDEGA